MQNRINWNRIYLEYSPKLLGICRRYVPDLASAEDILQDSFLTAIQKQGQLRSIDFLFPWLKKIVVNNALYYLKNSNQNLFVNTENQDIPDNSNTMIQTIEDNNLVLGYDFSTEELLWSIDQLPEHHKSVFNLYYLENYSHAQIAELLGININTSKSHLLRAKKKIQELLIKKTEGKTIAPIKKKAIKALVFLGFGNLLWAQSFQSKFKNFKIEPTKKVDFSGYESVWVSSNESKKQLQSVALKRIMAVSVFFFGLILINRYNIGNFSFINYKHYQSESVNESSIKKTTPKFEKVKAPHLTPEIKDSKMVLSEKENTVKKTIATLKTKNEKINFLKKTTSEKAQEKQNPESEMKTAKAETVDTTQSQKKPVVVVKKIVKKVKVYVEK